jgi:hypothetical protein
MGKARENIVCIISQQQSGHTSYPIEKEEKRLIYDHKELFTKNTKKRRLFNKIENPSKYEKKKEM